VCQLVKIIRENNLPRRYTEEYRSTKISSLLYDSSL
jgi:hypothetical protein